MIEPKELLEIATDLARRAGIIARERRDNGSFTISVKSSATDPVTEVDRACEQLIVSGLNALRPDDGILGEEGASVISSSGVEWFIDPIDGTTNFTYGAPSYCVSIGATVDGIPTVGAVYNPVLDEMFSAAAGHGATLNGLPITVNSVTALDMALIATGFSYSPENRRRQGTQIAQMLPEIRDIRRSGSAALDMCSVACGRVDAYFEATVNSWDVAAGTVIAREAGALAAGFDTANPETDVVVSCTPDLDNALRAALSRHS